MRLDPFRIRVRSESVSDPFRIRVRPESVSDPFRIRVRPESVSDLFRCSEYLFDPNKRYYQLIKDLFHVRFSSLIIFVNFISVFAKNE